MKHCLFLLSFVLSFLLISSTTTASGQSKKPAESRIEELPSIPLDTLHTMDPETKIILYSNNTWSYFRPKLVLYDELPVYSEHWDTTQIFSYRPVELKDLPETIDFLLAESMSEFHPPIIGKVFSKYGPRRGRNHNGVDIPLKKGEPIYSSFEGKVRYAKYNTGVTATW